MTDFKAIIKKLSLKENLTGEEAKSAFNSIMSGEVSEPLIAAFLMGLSLKGETVEEITSAVSVMREKMVKISAPSDAIDVCGTGGDAKGTYNISTAVSFIVSACGVAIAKHGNRSVSSKSGAADVLSELGVNIDAPVKTVERCINQIGIGFMMAPMYHSAMRFVAPVRKELGIRTIFNLLGPLSNPASVKRQLIGVFDKKWAKPLAEVLKELGSENVWVVHSGDGLDEITSTGKTFAAQLKDEEIHTFEINPNQYGLASRKLDELKGGDAKENAQALLKLLEGEEGAYRDIVLINSAAALIVADKVQDIEEGIELAKEVIDNGKARAKLDELIRMTNE